MVGALFDIVHIIPMLGVLEKLASNFLKNGMSLGFGKIWSYVGPMFYG